MVHSADKCEPNHMLELIRMGTYTKQTCLVVFVNNMLHPGFFAYLSHLLKGMLLVAAVLPGCVNKHIGRHPAWLMEQAQPGKEAIDDHHLVAICTFVSCKEHAC